MEWDREKLIKFNWNQIHETGYKLINSIGITDLELVEYDTIPLVLHVWKWLKLALFNLYYRSGTDYN